MWKRGGQYEGKIRRVWALVGIVICFVAYGFASDLAVEKRVVSTLSLIHI